MPENCVATILIQKDTCQRQVMQEILEQAGSPLWIAGNLRSGLELVEEYRPRLVIIDLCQEDLDHRDILQQIKTCHSQARVLLITTSHNVELVLDSIHWGATDCLHKPFTPEQFAIAVYKILLREGPPQQDRPKKSAVSAENRPLLLGNSSRIQVVRNLIHRMAPSRASVLILGESGTGKELAARLLHGYGSRCAGPFVAVNCAAIPGALLESELFGHTRGAFSGAVRDHVGKFEQADHGTLFLDEVGELPMELQPKLLRVLQEQEVTPVGGIPKAIDFRVIAATNCNLEELVAEGRFRSDLFYRLAVLPLTMPALRERCEDIPLLAHHFLTQHARDDRVRLSAAAVETLQNYPWPGNVRELQNLMERLAILDRKGLIDNEDLPVHLHNGAGAGGKDPCVVRLPPEGFPLKDIERQAIMQALLLSRGNLTRAAVFLQVPRHILAYRINKYALKEMS